MPDPFDPPAERSDALLRPPPRRTLRDRLDRVADATGTTPGRLAAGAGAVAAAVVLALLLTRPAAPPPEVALPFASTVVATTPTSSPTTATERLLVHVAGAVARPGVHELEPGARVVDAVDAAGGLGPAADSARLNLAAPVADGERVYVPAVGEEPPAVVAGGKPGEPANGTDAPALVDLNTADADELDALPGIGPATAAAIIEHRDRVGGFTSVDQLLDVRGIGEAKLEQLRPLVTV